MSLVQHKIALHVYWAFLKQMTVTFLLHSFSILGHSNVYLYPPDTPTIRPYPVTSEFTYLQKICLRFILILSSYLSLSSGL